MDRLVFVDFDDTLFFTFFCVEKVTEEKFGRKMSKDEVRKLPKSEKSKIYREAFLKYWNLSKPNTKMIELLKDLKKKGYLIFILTARGKDTLNITLEMLKKHKIPFDKLLYRENLMVKDEIWKAEMIRRYLPISNEILVFDDKEENLRVIFETLRHNKEKIKLYLVSNNEIKEIKY